MTAPAPAPLPPEQNFTPWYIAFGVALLFLFIAITVTVLVLVVRQTPPPDLIVKVLAALAAADFFGFLLFILRPKRFDDIFRTVIAAVPWTKYQGTPPTGGAS